MRLLMLETSSVFTASGAVCIHNNLLWDQWDVACGLQFGGSETDAVAEAGLEDQRLRWADFQRQSVYRQ